jgi:hypothetical protein
MARRNGIVTAGLLAGCALLAGCGATTRHVAGTPAPAPRYVAQGNAICSAELARLDRLPRPTTPEQTVAYLPRALAAMRQEVASLRGLDPPGSAGRELAAALSNTDQLAALLGHLLHELRVGTVEFGQLAAVQRRTSAMRGQLDASFRSAGLARCAH